MFKVSHFIPFECENRQEWGAENKYCFRRKWTNFSVHHLKNSFSAQVKTGLNVSNFLSTLLNRVTAFMTLLSQLTHLLLQGQNICVLHVWMDGVKKKKRDAIILMPSPISHTNSYTPISYTSEVFLHDRKSSLEGTPATAMLGTAELQRIRATSSDSIVCITR